MLDAMGPNAVAILVGAGLATRSNDTEYPFRQNSDFWYLTGFGHPDAVCVLRTTEGPDFTLFVQPHDAAAETWTGYRPGIEGATADFGADQAFERSAFGSSLRELLRGAERIYHVLGRSFRSQGVLVGIHEPRQGSARGRGAVSETAERREYPGAPSLLTSDRDWRA